MNKALKQTTKPDNLSIQCLLLSVMLACTNQPLQRNLKILRQKDTFKAEFYTIKSIFNCQRKLLKFLNMTSIWLIQVVRQIKI